MQMPVSGDRERATLGDVACAQLHLALVRLQSSASVRFSLAEAAERESGARPSP